MTIASLANPKGGAGKTTSCIGLCTGLTQSGYSVLALDTDPNMYLTQWRNDRQQQIDKGVDIVSFPVYTVLNAKDLVKILSENEDKYDWIVIDTPGFDSGLNRLALGSSAIAVFSTKSGGLDKKSIPQISQISQQLMAENPILQCYMFGCALSNHHLTINDDIEYIQGVTDSIEGLQMFPAYSQHRTGYGRCTELGLAPQEMGNKDIDREIKDLVDGFLAIEAGILEMLNATELEAEGA